MEGTQGEFERRLDRLERRTRTAIRVAIVLGVVFVIAGGIAAVYLAREHIPVVVKAQRFVVTSGDGRALGSFGAWQQWEHAEPRVELLDKQGNARVSLGVRLGGEGYLNIAEDGGYRIRIGPRALHATDSREHRDLDLSAEGLRISTYGDDLAYASLGADLLLIYDGGVVVLKVVDGQPAMVLRDAHGRAVTYRVR